jgi:PPOX class probable F420-dependent enzyme
MANKRASIEMTADEIDTFLAEPRSMNVATIGPSGHPHVVAMWYGFHGGDRFSTGKPVFWTFGKSQKVLNIRRDPKISVLVEAGTPVYNELKGVELVGTARIVDDFDSVLAVGLSVGMRYQGPAVASDAALPFLEAQARKRVAVVIDVERIVSWDHAKLGGAY